MVNVDVPPGEARLAGEKTTVTPGGSPVAPSVIGVLKDPPAVDVRVAVAVDPALTVMLGALEVKARLGGAGIVSEIAAVAVIPPPIAVGVIV